MSKRLSEKLLSFVCSVWKRNQINFLQTTFTTNFDCLTAVESRLALRASFPVSRQLFSSRPSRFRKLHLFWPWINSYKEKLSTPWQIPQIQTFHLFQNTQTNFLKMIWTAFEVTKYFSHSERKRTVEHSHVTNDLITLSLVREVFYASGYFYMA